LTWLTAAALLLGACADAIVDPFSGALEDGTVTVAPPDSGTGQPPDSTRPKPSGEGRILIDASRDGGLWWFPQAGPFDSDAPHQGQAFAEYLRSLGYTVDELGRNVVVTEALLDQYTTVIRAGEWGAPHAGELDAYRRFLEREVTLVLLSDHRLTDPTDELAESLGVSFGGAVDGAVTIFEEHAITAGMGEVPYLMGAAVVAADPSTVTILGRLADGTPVMGVIASPSANIFFLGDTNTLELVPQPLVDNLLAWGF
jgi:hypothetical protein